MHTGVVWASPIYSCGKWALKTCPHQNLHATDYKHSLGSCFGKIILKNSCAN